MSLEQVKMLPETPACVELEDDTLGPYHGHQRVAEENIDTG